MASLLGALSDQASFLAEPTTKELLVTPRGVRLVVRLAEAERGTYLLFRDAQFAHRPLEPEWVRALLDRALAILGAAHRVARPAHAAA